MSNLIKLKQIKGGTTLQADVTKAKQDITDLTTGLGSANTNIETMQSDIEVLQNALGLGEGEGTGSVATQISDAIAAAEDNCYVVEKTSEHADDMAAIATLFTEENGKTPAKGDTCVVKSLIAADKYAHTGYVFDGEWKAMDGNYSAENVFFANNLTITANVGVQTLGTGEGSKTLETTGKSVKQVMELLFSKETNPTTTQPDVELTVSGGSGEVGTTFTLPTATLKMTTAGSYTYGPATGVTIPAGSATISEGTDNSVTSNTEMVKDSTLTLKATGDNTYLDTTVSFTFNAEATTTAGSVPKTNLGNDYTDGKIESKTFEKSAVANFTGYRQYFYGTVDNTDALTSDMIRGLSGKGGNYNASKSISINASSANHKRFILAIPSSSTRGGLKKAMSTAGMTVEVTGAYVKTAKAVKVEGANGATAVDYDVWIWQPDTIDSGVKHTIDLA